MKYNVTYLSPKLKKIATKMVLITSIGTVLLTGCGVNKNNDENKSVDNESNISSMINENEDTKIYKGTVEVTNYEYCNNSSEFLAFIAEDGRIISTVPVGEGTYDVNIPGASKYVYSPVLDIKKEIKDLNSEDEYKISVDYKNKQLAFSTMEKSRGR